MNPWNEARTLVQTIVAINTSDGAGVKLRRSIGATPALRLDPFLLLDEFGTENPDDYIAGFPAHPHRGFETVTYMLDGHMRHEDHLGNVGELKSGGVQWMTAGRGVIHSEMPQQESGRMRGFQLWINLAAHEKMQPAAYRDIPADALPTIALPGGSQLKLIAGRLSVNNELFSGPINDPDHAMTTDPLFIDITLPPEQRQDLPLTRGHNAFVYVYQGSAIIGSEVLNSHQAGVLSDGDHLQLMAGKQELRAVLLAGKPLNEPVVQHGPFVMNTREEIDQAIDDYRHHRLTD